MNTKKVKRVLEQVAQKRRVSVEDVRHEIELIIASGQEHPDPEIKAFWQAVPRKGEKPTPEEVVAHITSLFIKTGEW